MSRLFAALIFNVISLFFLCCFASAAEQVELVQLLPKYSFVDEKENYSVTVKLIRSDDSRTGYLAPRSCDELLYALNFTVPAPFFLAAARANAAIGARDDATYYRTLNEAIALELKKENRASVGMYWNLRELFLIKYSFDGKDRSSKEALEKTGEACWNPAKTASENFDDLAVSIGNALSEN